MFSEEDAHSFRRLADPLIAVVRAAPALASVAVHSWVGVALGSVPYRVARHAPNLRSLSVMCPDGEGTFEFNLRIASREWRAFLAVCPPAIEHIAFHGLSSPLDTADMALLLRCAPQLRSLELLTEAAWPEAMTSTSRQERARREGEEEEEEEEDDEQPSSRRRLMLPAISEAEFRDCEALLAGRNSEPSRSLQRLAIVDAVHATVEQVLLPLIRGSGCGVESVRVWLCNTADSKRVVLEALAHNAGAVRDVVVPHNAVDDTLLRQLARATALERFAAIKPALFAFDSAGVTVDEPERFDPQLLLDLLHACRELRELVLHGIQPTAALVRAVGQLAHLRVFGWHEEERETESEACDVLRDATLFRSLQYLWVHVADHAEPSPFVNALTSTPLAPRVVRGQFQGLAVLTSAIRVRWHENFDLSAGQRDLAFAEFERQD